MKCTSCDKETTKNVTFPCPKCGNQINRCEKCRNLSIEYKCSKCNYRGP